MHTSNRTVSFIRHNGNNNAIVTNGEDAVRVAYGGVRGYLNRYTPIEAIHAFGQKYEAIYLKIRDSVTGDIKYYRGALDHRLNPISRPGGNRRDSILLHPVDSMSYGMALLDYVLNGGKLK